VVDLHIMASVGPRPSLSTWLKYSL